MDRQRLLGLALCAVALVLVVWGLMAARFPSHKGALKVDPPPAASIGPTRTAKPVVVFVDANGALTIDGSPSSLDTLKQDLGARAPDTNREVMLRAADNLPYKTLMPVMRKLEATGRYKTGLILDAAPAR